MFHSVPRRVLILLALAFLMQVTWRGAQPAPQAQAYALQEPPSLAATRAISFGEPIASAQWLTLYLQAFDNQPGISIPYRDLNYARVSGWLALLLDLDPSGQYPMLMASHLYAQVPDPERQRQMLEFTYKEFFADPQRRWPWLAHAAIVAKHRLHDLPLALKYAQAVATRATGNSVPHWAQQMPIFILEDMNELESAKIMLGALLANGSVTDPHEMHFLMERYHALEEKLTKNQQLRRENDTTSPAH